jgi:hypothetical protein
MDINKIARYSLGILTYSFFAILGIKIAFQDYVGAILVFFIGTALGMFHLHLTRMDEIHAQCEANRKFLERIDKLT